MKIVLGEPTMLYRFTKHAIGSGSQLDLSLKARKRYRTKRSRINRLREEYISIARSLRLMEIDFSVALSHFGELDKELCTFLDTFIGENKVPLPEYFSPKITAFPRDLCVSLPSITMTHPGFTLKEESDDLFTSPYGEGGRVLYCGNRVLIGECIPGQELQTPHHYELLRKRGFQVAAFPLAHTIGTDKVNGYGGHLDRTACLIKGQSGKTHLVIDPEIEILRTKAVLSDGRFHVEVLSHQETMKFILSICEPLQIEVHAPEKVTVPGSLCLIQFGDGRVLMTSGDKSVADTVCNIVGKDKVNYTDIPIEVYPAFAFAGIRCLIGEF